MACRRSRKQKLPQQAFEAQIESLSHEGRGVAHVDGKTTFISGALPGETVKFHYTWQRRTHAEGKVSEILSTSPVRVEPKCTHYEICGGCSLQHLSSKAQIDYKQQAMLESLKHLGKVSPAEVFEPLTGDNWGYRRKARLGVKFVYKKDKVLVGFRERQGGFLADIDSCVVLHPAIGLKLQTLQQEIYQMDCRDSVPQIEVAIGDAPMTSDATQETVALIVRHLKPLSDKDTQHWMRIASENDFVMYLQPKGPDSVHRIWPQPDEQESELFYQHPEFSTRINFGPQDFFQVNNSINLKMVPRAVELLELTGSERVLDLFCGLGNFTLPIALHAEQVTGIEGDLAMVKRARDTAIANGIANTDYYACNLMGGEQDLRTQPWLKQDYQRVLLDPPRSGAKEILPHIAKLKAERIVYVSCNPATLARDAGELVNAYNYELAGAGVMDMFPQTAHVESIAVFNRK